MMFAVMMYRTKLFQIFPLQLLSSVAKNTNTGLVYQTGLLNTECEQNWATEFRELR